CSGSVGSNTTFCISTTTSGPTVIVPGNGPLAGVLQQALSGASGGTIANALGAVLGGNAVQPGGSSVTAFDIIGPAGPIPVGFEPGTSALVPGAVNCNGRPSGTVWPVPNCNFTGYGTFLVAAGTQDVLINTDFGGPQITVAANSSALNWLSGDL